MKLRGHTVFTNQPLLALLSDDNSNSFICELIHTTGSVITVQRYRRYPMSMQHIRDQACKNMYQQLNIVCILTRTALRYDRNIEQRKSETLVTHTAGRRPAHTYRRTYTTLPTPFIFIESKVDLGAWT
jgi:hypothetical protein